jgi:hypothetical protein
VGAGQRAADNRLSLAGRTEGVRQADLEVVR